MRTREYSHPALTEFATIAGAFCRVVENRDQMTPELQLNEIHRLLPRAYFAALELPDTSVLFDDGDDDDSREPEPEPAHLPVTLPPGLDRLAEFLSLHRFYREVFDPYAESTEGEVTGDLIDDLGDIYVDMHAGLVHWRNGETGHALWEWRFNFQIHWAEHATSALRAIFALSAWHAFPWPAGAG
ncbi:MAG TPA: DUF5063 domain-containing protein [Polyangiaceae bacterium]|nr:DUF5063 domain-containing protein [Polyangiaceae bacterium]